MGKTKDLGHLAHIVAYNAENHITVPAGITMHTNQLVASQAWVTTALGSYALSSSLSSYVPTSRTITINGTTFDLSANRNWDITSMIYPAAGIALSTGSAWGTSITNNSANWNTAFGWGNHASAGYLTGITSAQVTTALGFTPVTNARTITINGTTFDLSADRSYTISTGTTLNGTGFVKASGTTITYDNSTYLTGITSALVTGALGYTPYNSTNPAGYITGISFANVSSKPTTLSGYGITDAVPSARTITINGTAFDLSANRSWTITLTEADTLATVMARGASTASGITFTAPGGTVLLKHAVSEVDAWIFQENAANWGIYWKNNPSGNHTFGGYTTIGAETFGMSAANASGNGVLTSNFVGATSAYAQWMLSNYTGYIWSASTIFAAGDMRAPIYYDSNDTAYYLNPAGGSRLRNLYVGDSGDDWSDPGGWGTQIRFSNGPHVKFVLHARSPGIEAGMYVHTPGSVFIGSFTSHDVSFMYGGSRKMGFNASYIYTDVYLEAAGSLRAPIFYDSNDTGYYLDPNNTGVALRIAGAIRGDHVGWTGEHNKIQWHSNHMYFQNMADGYWIFRRSNGSEPFLLHADGWGQASGSWRAPIFYDSNDTAYYLDPNSESNLYRFTSTTMTRNAMNYLSINSPFTTRAAQAGPYQNGTMGWGTVDFNTVFSNWGSGFIDTWSNPGNAPGGSSHYVGIQSCHYNHQNSANVYGFQMACAGEADNRFFWRSAWPSIRGWVEMVHSGNILSFSTSGNSANTIVRRDGSGDIGIGTLNTNHAYFGGGGRGLTSSDTYGSYGNVHTYGTGQNGYSGYGIRTAAGYRTFFMAEGGNYGIYAQDWGKWAFYFSAGTQSYSIGSSDPVSGYTLYLIYGLYTVGLYNASDARMKKDIKPLSSSLDKVKQLRGVSYEYIDKGEDGTKNKGLELGFIAQEVLPIIPELIRYDEKKGYAMNYNGVSAVLVEAIKEQQVQIENQQNQINTLISQLTELLNK